MCVLLSRKDTMYKTSSRRKKYMSYCLSPYVRRDFLCTNMYRWTGFVKFLYLGVLIFYGHYVCRSLRSTIVRESGGHLRKNPTEFVFPSRDLVFRNLYESWNLNSHPSLEVETFNWLLLIRFKIPVSVTKSQIPSFKSDSSPSIFKDTTVVGPFCELDLSRS